MWMLALLPAWYVGCNQDPVKAPEQDLEAALRAAPEVAKLEEIRNEVADRLIDGNIDWPALRRALETRNEAWIAELLGYDPDEMAAIGKQLAASRESLLRRFPELAVEAEAVRRECAACDAPDFADRVLRNLERLRQAGPLKSEVVHCRYFPYIAALTVCAAAGPALYVPCAIVALCSYCEGGWVSVVCG